MECNLNHRPVYYEICGEGRPLLVIPGIPSDHRIIQSWLEPIFEALPGWQRIYFDLPGTGKTPGEGITHIDQVLDVVCDFIEFILPGQTFPIVGLSVGGYLARGVAHRKPARVGGLCLIVPWLSENAEVPEPVTLIHDPAAMAQLSPDDAEKLNGLSVIQSQEIVDWYRQVVIPARESPQHATIDEKTFSFQPDPFQKPALILMGRQDAHVGYREGWNILEQYPRATFTVLDQAGHALGVERPGLFRALVCEWLERVGGNNKA